MGDMLQSPANFSARDLIEKIGLKRSYASQLWRGLKRPALELAVRIEDELGVPPSWWIKRPDLVMSPSSQVYAQAATAIDGAECGRAAGETEAAG